MPISEKKTSEEKIEEAAVSVENAESFTPFPEVDATDVVSEISKPERLFNPEPELQPEVNQPSLSSEELRDPNLIRVTIADSKAPVVVLFGPPACGKTMTLVRLTRFLQSEGYTVSPIRTFRPSEDHSYEEICKHFDETMNSASAAATTDRISFMLVEVIKDGRRLCQILEAPGEYYFDPQQPKAGFPNYVNTIINSSNRKVWAIMAEPDWMNIEDRRNYVDKIRSLKTKMRPKDDVVFVFNKIDLTNFVVSPGVVRMSSAIGEVKNLYPGIFVPFENKNPITKWFKKYNCEFVPFQTGDYSNSTKGLTYQEGPREYCVKLWRTIMNKIRG